MTTDDTVNPSPSKPCQPYVGLISAIVLAAVVSFAIWYVFGPPDCTATALFRVDSRKWSLFDDDGGMLEPGEFEILQKTQIALLKSYFVLQSAIRDPAIASLPLLAGKADQVDWLQKNIEVQFPQNSEVLAIRLRGDDVYEEDLRRIVDAVATAYEREIVYTEKARRLLVRDAFARALRKVEQDLNEKMRTYYEIKKELSSDESADLDLGKQQIDTASEIVREMNRRLKIIDINAEAAG